MPLHHFSQLCLSKFLRAEPVLCALLPIVCQSLPGSPVLENCHSGISVKLL